MMKPYMHAQWYIDAAENEESLEPEDRQQLPTAGSVELSPTGTERNVRVFAYSNPDCNVYLWSCTGGDSIYPFNIAISIRRLV